MLKVIKKIGTIMAPTDKFMFLEKKILDKDLRYVAVITVASLLRLPAASLQKKKLVLSKGSYSKEDLEHLLSFGTAIEDVSGIVSKETYEVYSVLASLDAVGITKKQADKLLSLYPMPIKEAFAVLELTLEEPNIPVLALNACGVCGRYLISITEGACRTCRSTIVSFLEFRRYPFEIPITKENFRFHEKYTDTPIRVTYQDWVIEKQDRMLKAHHEGYTLEQSLEVPLEILTYAKEIK